MDDAQLERRLGDLEKQNRHLSTGLYAIATTFCVLLGIWNLYQSLQIPNFHEAYFHWLNGKALPALTTFVVKASLVHLALSVALPVAAIVTFLTRRRSATGLWILLAITLVITCQLVVTRRALWIPIHGIITEMWE